MLLEENKAEKAMAMDPEIDYKNLALLDASTSDSGKIIPGRNTGTSHKKQREVARAIKIARSLALIPYTDKR